nr:sulfite exporter TauE/SafE family protein 4 [Ipomoea batatas]
MAATMGFVVYLLAASCVAVLSVFYLQSHHANGSYGPPAYISSTIKLASSSQFPPPLRSESTVWPELKFSWRSVLATMIGFLGSACGTVGGVGGGGIFVPMLTLIVGFDTKFCRHDNGGISIIGTSSRSAFRGIEMWKEETKMKRVEAERQTIANSHGELSINTEYEPLVPKEERTGLFPVALVLFGYECAKLYKESKSRRLAGNQELICEAAIDWTVTNLAFCALCGIVGGTVGGLLGSGGGFILGPLLLEFGVIPQVASATATFVMMYSSSLSVVEFYLLKRFPMPYAINSMHNVAWSIICSFIPHERVGSGGLLGSVFGQKNRRNLKEGVNHCVHPLWRYFRQRSHDGGYRDREECEHDTESRVHGVFGFL